MQKRPVRRAKAQETPKIRTPFFPVPPQATPEAHARYRAEQMGHIWGSMVATVPLSFGVAYTLMNFLSAISPPTFTLMAVVWLGSATSFFGFVHDTANGPFTRRKQAAAAGNGDPKRLAAYAAARAFLLTAIPYAPVLTYGGKLLAKTAGVKAARPELRRWTSRLRLPATAARAAHAPVETPTAQAAAPTAEPAAAPKPPALG